MPMIAEQEIEYDCKCQRCGKRYRADINVPDDFWEQIKPRGKSRGAGLLCGRCIIEAIEFIVGYSAWRLERI